MRSLAPSEFRLTWTFGQEALQARLAIFTCEALDYQFALEGKTFLDWQAALHRWGVWPNTADTCG